MPLGTVVMPVKNVSAWIAEALGSIDHSDDLDLEILCVEDRSTDDTVAAIEAVGDPRIRIVPNRGAGVADGRNTGLAEARGTEIYYLDGDDRFCPGAIGRLHAALGRHPEAAAVAGYTSVITESGRELACVPFLRDEGPINERLLQGRFIHHSAFVFRKAALEELGWARNFFRMGEDNDFLFRLAERYPIRYVPVHVSETRSRRGSVSRTTKAALTQWYCDQALAFRDERRATGTDALMRGTPPPVPENLPVAAPNSASAFENRVLTGSAWIERARGNRGAAARYLMRSLLTPRYLPHRPGEKVRLAAVLLRDGLYGAFRSS